MVFGRQMREEGADFRNPHFAGVTLVMEEDEAPNPVDVGFFGAERIMFETQRLPDQIEQFRGICHQNLLCRMVGVCHNKIAC